MKRIGIRHINLGNIEGLKQQLLYFDHIYFEVRSFQSASSLVASAISGSLPLELAEDVRGEAMKLILGPDETTVDFLVEKGLLIPYDNRSVLTQELGFKRNEAPPSPLPEEHKAFLREHLGRDVDESELIGFELSPRSGFEFDEETIVKFGQLMLAEVDSWLAEGGELPTEIASEESFDNVLQRLSSANTHRIKLLAMLKSMSEPADVYVPILHDSELAGDGQLLREQQVAKLIIDRFPTPLDSVSWEQILEFRLDPSNSTNLSALRRWVAKLTVPGHNQREIEEEIEYLLQEYERLMQLHRLKYDVGTLELAVVTTLEVLENILKLNWSTAARKLFELKRRKVDFALSVSSLQGRELAYLSDVRKRFGSDSADSAR